jgi:tetratricopeptide (TPR) repeat protein
MKKIIALICFCVGLQCAFAQALDIDSVYQMIASEKDESKRLKELNLFFGSPETSDPMIDMQYAQRILTLSQKNNDKISEALALSQIGWDYIAFGNTVKGLEYRLKSIEVAEKSNNLEMLADSKLHLGLYYYEQKDYERAIDFGFSGNENAIEANNEIMQTWAYWLLGDSYYELNKLDSALMYAQRAYDICVRIKYFDYIHWTYESLGKIQGKLGNQALALGYFDLAIKEAIKKNSLTRVSQYYTSLAQYYFDNNQKDSCSVYAKKAIGVVQNTAFTSSSLIPAKLLLDIYRTSSCDSAFKYSEIYRIANDSLFNITKIKQANLMTFTEDLRQQELATEKMKAEDERKHNIQLSLLAIGIITFIILFLLLSRGFITNTKLIEFLSVIALLLVFEFLNLLVHPFLEDTTHHSPVLMLLALVCMAALLVPLHHRLEKWTANKLIEKNREIRLANAKRTIEKLEEKAVDLNENSTNA